MKNKLLIKVIVPSIEKNFNVYIPINKKIGTVKTYILNSIVELSEGYFLYDDKRIFIDRDSSMELNDDSYVKDSGLKNGSKIVIL